MTAALSFRQAKPEDYKKLAAIWDASWHSTGVDSPEHLDLEALANRLEKMVSEGATLFSVENGDLAIGLILLIEADRCLSQLFLAPSQQNNGLGTVCLDFVKHRFRDGFWLSVAEANQAAVRFYERNDLHCVHRQWRPQYERFDLRYEWNPKPE